MLDWFDRGACRNQPSEWWFAEDGWQTRAKRICNVCPVKTECLDWAMRMERQDGPESRVGVYGGLNVTERIALAKQRRAA